MDSTGLNFDHLDAQVFISVAVVNFVIVRALLEGQVSTPKGSYHVLLFRDM
jgi:hypothetical protein